MNNEIKDLALSQSFTLKNGLLVEFSDTELASMVNTAAAASRISPGTILDSKYRLLSLLGEGGMGAVYLAHHIMLNKDVALKTIHTNQLSLGALERFEREVKSVAALQNPHVVKIFDFGIGEGNQPFYTMELLHGQSLGASLEENGRLSTEATLAIFAEVCMALISAHKKGIIHRDLKPANIFLQLENGQQSVKLVDFGIAKLMGSEALAGQKLTATGTVFGSPLYMSPEQSLGLTVDARSDIYSLGCSLTETLTGRPPFIGKNAFATLHMHQHDSIPRLGDLTPNQSFPAWLEALVERMLTKNPDERIQSCEEVLDILQFQIANNGSEKSQRSSSNISGQRYKRSNQDKPPESKQWLGKGAIYWSVGTLSVALFVTVSCSLWNIFGQSVQEENIYLKRHDNQAITQPTIAPPLNLNKPSEATNSPADLDKDFLINASPTDTFSQPRAGLLKDTYRRENQTLSRDHIKEIVSTKAEVAELNGDKLDNSDLYLLKSSQLEKLNLADSNLDDTGADAISQCRTLKFLRISGTKVTESGLLSLTKLKKLTKLYIEGLPVKSAVLAAWSKNQALDVLSLRSCPAIDYKTLEQLQKSRISELTLQETALNDSSLLALTNFSDLAEINVGSTQVTAKGLEKLCQRQPKLQVIKVMGCPNISSGQLAKLKNQFRLIRFDIEQLPELDIMWEKTRQRF